MDYVWLMQNMLEEWLKMFDIILNSLAMHVNHLYICIKGLANVERKSLACRWSERYRFIRSVAKLNHRQMKLRKSLCLLQNERV